MKYYFYRFILMSILPFSGCSCSMARDQAPKIYWPDTRLFEARSIELKMTKEQAMNSLLEALKLKSDRRFRLRLAVLLIVNDEYLIGIPEKASTPLTGFYINPESGRIEYRVSSNASLAYKAQIKESIKFRSIEAVR